MELLKKQQFFAQAFARLLIRASDLGFGVTIGEVERSKIQALQNAMTGKGIKNSLHLLRLAGDIHLFKDDKYLDKSEDYKQLGDYWKSLSTKDFNCTWGGDFKSRPDGNHFSVEHEGVR